MSPDRGGEPERTVEVFRALAHPTRCAMLRQIGRHEEVPRAALEESMGLPADMASYHLKILVQADVVEMRRRGRNVFYALRHGTVAGVRDQLAGLGQTSLQLAPATVPGPEPRAASSGAGGR
jgi:ArsR family transcriptional regulator